MKVFEHGRIGRAATTGNDDVKSANVGPLAVAVFRDDTGYPAATIRYQVYGPCLGQNDDTPFLYVPVQQGPHHVQNGYASLRTVLIAPDQIGVVTGPGYRVTVTNCEAVFSKPIDGRSAI